jgi:hypothetical protein
VRIASQLLLRLELLSAPQKQAKVVFILQEENPEVTISPAMAVLDVLNANSTLFRVYVTWCCILLGKTMLMTLLTVVHRFKNKVSRSEECEIGGEFHAGNCFDRP